MDRLRAMHTFVRVVEAGGFSAVARESNTSQSAISKQVAALERHLGVTLLTRSTRALALTDAGERYFEQARRLTAEVAEAEHALRHGELQLDGLLRVAAPVGFGLRVLMPLVRQFLASHPAVRIDLRLDDSTIDLVEQGIDLTVRIGQLGDSALVARRVGSSPSAIVATRSYLARPGGPPAPRVPQDLVDHACIVYTTLSTRNLWHFSDAAGREVAVGVQGPLQSNSSEVVRAAVMAGMGIARAPVWMMDDALARASWQVLLPDWRMAPLPIHLVYPQHRRHAAKVKAFSDFLAKRLGQDEQAEAAGP